jgi:hypothetical protein
MARKEPDPPQPDTWTSLHAARAIGPHPHAVASVRRQPVWVAISVLHTTPPLQVDIIHLIRTFYRSRSRSLLRLCRLVPGGFDYRCASYLDPSRDVRNSRQRPAAKTGRMAQSPSARSPGLPEPPLGRRARSLSLTRRPVAQLCAASALSSPSRTLASVATAWLSCCAASASQIFRASAFLLAFM